MTTQAESEFLTQTGPGTAMGDLMRQYWIPAAASSEITADGDPVRIKLLGEELIAFRDSSGRVGIMDHRCPHRCASFFFGRNEEDGIRCVYHGWKFDVEGNCLDMANVPPHQDFKQKIKAKAYKTAERNGLVWVFMGDQSSVPALPDIEPNLLPENEVRIMFVQRECNYMQALEGDIDTSHFSFLHAGGVNVEDISRDEIAHYNIVHPQPEYHVADTDWGTMYGAHRPAGPDQTYWRFAQFFFPFWTMPPDGDFADHIIARAWVPMDDTHTMFVHISWMNNKPGLRTDKAGVPLPGMSIGMEKLPNTTDWLGRFRTKANAGNDYLLDRAAQRNGNYTGITGIHLQDQAITESMGAITDHGFEHLSPSDEMITQTRRRLVVAAREFAKTGAPPPCVTNPDVFLKARGGDFVAPKEAEWRDVYDQQMQGSKDPTGRLLAAE
ncbi:MAG: Rieske 2Fe-2S domain-containing protein [Rhodospirillaceae bacterium]|nr:Rieske 2Fe-2S domain-containing protein [Rhodospirillaceae bacterium]